MQVKQILLLAEKKLNKHGINTSRLDSLVLLEDALNKDRTWLLSHDDTEISSAEELKFNLLLNRRLTHEPLAYVRSKTEFYGREFIIKPGVLEPRPESETMIDLLKHLVVSSESTNMLPKPFTLIDVGTGSGALGITAMLELKNCQVKLLDISQVALKIAKMNVEKFTLNISVMKSDLLSQVSTPAEILLCNLPYIPDDFKINLAAKHEPKLAIFGGKDGLDLYRKLFKQVSELPIKPLFILTESLPPQHSDLCRIALANDYKLELSEDFIQVFTQK